MVELAGVAADDAAAPTSAASGRLAPAAGDAETGGGGGADGGSCAAKRLARLESAPRHASKRFLLSNQLMEPTGGWGAQA